MSGQLMARQLTGERSLVVIPTYQEAENIRAVLDAVLSVEPGVDVLVVDDDSPDGTADLVRSHLGYGARVHLLSRADKDGLGSAYRAGFAWALDAGYARIAQMDADLSHPPERLPALLAALDEADVAVGSRYVPGGGAENWPLSRRLISGLGNRYVRAVLGLQVRDSTAGFKAFRANALREIEVLDSESNGYCFQIENTWRAARRRLRVVEVPITFTDRTNGTSKMSLGIMVEALLRVLGWRLAQFGVSREVATFLGVGGVGYLVDVAAFNWFLSAPGLSSADPSYARVLAVGVAMVVTYFGNRFFTWRGQTQHGRRHEIGLFVLFNLIGLGLGVLCLVVSHDLLGLTSRTADNISANVVGLILGTAFRFWSYRTFVFNSEERPGWGLAWGRRGRLGLRIAR